MALMSIYIKIYLVIVFVSLSDQRNFDVSKKENLKDEKIFEHNSNTIEKEIEILYETNEEEKNLSPERILTTNLFTGLYYCLIENRNNFTLRFDGTSADSAEYYYGFGLSLNSKVGCELSDRYWFKIEASSNYFQLKNYATNFYLSRQPTWDRFFLSRLNNLDNLFQLIFNAEETYNLYFPQSNLYLGYRTFGLSTSFGTLYRIEATRSSFELIGNFSFILKKPNLYAKIYSFDYGLPIEITDNNITQSIILTKSIIDNNSDAKITHEISYVEKFEQLLEYEFDNKHKVSEEILDRSSPIIVNYKNSLKTIDISAAVKLIEKNINFPQNGLKFTNNGINYIKKTIEIQANSSVSVEAFIEKYNGLEIRFIAEAEIFGEQFTTQLPGFVIASILQNDYNITRINENSIIAKVSGVIRANIVLNSVFNVENRI